MNWKENIAFKVFGICLVDFAIESLLFTAEMYKFNSSIYCNTFEFHIKLSHHNICDLYIYFYTIFGFTHCILAFICWVLYGAAQKVLNNVY